MLILTKKVVKTWNGNLLDNMNLLFVLKGGICYMKDEKREVIRLLKILLLCLLLALVLALLK